MQVRFENEVYDLEYSSDRKIEAMEITKFKGLKGIKKFIEELEKEFRMTDFTYILNEINKAIEVAENDYFPFNREIDLELIEENSFQKESIQNIYIKYSEEYDNSLARSYKTIVVDYTWTTSSGHTINISGTLSLMEDYEGTQTCDNHTNGYTLSIGTDESEFFYPTIKNITKTFNKDYIKEGN